MQNKETVFSEINNKFEELKKTLEGNDLESMRELALDLHAMVHPAEISGRTEKTVADFVLDYMMQGKQNELVPRETWDTDLHYAGTKIVPICWQFWHTYRIEDLVSNILMENGKQIFNDEWQRKIGSSITDTGKALEMEEVIEWGKNINTEELRKYMIAVGKNTRRILSALTLEQTKSMVPEEWVMRILEEGGVTTDFRSVWLLVFWGRLTVGGMILTPMTSHHMMHLPTSVNHIDTVLAAYLKQPGFETEQLLLRFVTEDDVAEAARTWPADHHPLSDAEAREAIAYMRGNYERNGKGSICHLCLAVCRKERPGTIMGWCGLDGTRNHSEPEIFILLDEAYQNRGYGTQCVKELLRLAVEDYALSSVHGGCAKENIASARVMEKGGMVQYGTEENGDPLFRFTAKEKAGR